MGRNPPKNLSKGVASRAAQLKKAHPKLTIKEAKALASAEIAGRIDSRASELEEAELMAPEIPEQLEIKDNLEQFVELTGVLPTPDQAKDIVEAVIEKRKGRYATQKKYAMAEDFRKKQLEKRILAALRTNVADSKRLQAIAEEGMRRGRSLSDAGVVYSSSTPISFIPPALSSSSSGVNFDSTTGSIVVPSSAQTITDPQSGREVDLDSSFGRFLLKKQREGSA